MDSPSGNSSICAKLQSSGSEEDLQALMDHRKRKRMQSNRESAKRSRMRKQKHQDDLTGQVSDLRKENSEILTSINITIQHYEKVEAENSVLRARMAELSHSLQSLIDILSFINTSTGVHETDGYEMRADNYMNPMDTPFLNQPIMASADVFQW